MKTQNQTEVVRVGAVNRVLQRLGEDLQDVVKFHLSRHYHIKLDESGMVTCSLEELSSALQKLIGQGAAELLMQEIYLELDAAAS